MADRDTPPDFLVETERHTEDCRGRFRLIAANPLRSMTEQVRDALGLECMSQMTEASCEKCKGDMLRCLFEIRGEDIRMSGAQCVDGHFLVSPENVSDAIELTGLDVGTLG